MSSQMRSQGGKKELIRAQLSDQNPFSFVLLFFWSSGPPMATLSSRVHISVTFRHPGMDDTAPVVLAFIGNVWCSDCLETNLIFLHPSVWASVITIDKFSKACQLQYSNSPNETLYICREWRSPSLWRHPSVDPLIWLFTDSLTLMSVCLVVMSLDSQERKNRSTRRSRGFSVLTAALHNINRAVGSLVPTPLKKITHQKFSIVCLTTSHSSSVEKPIFKPVY